MRKHLTLRFAPCPRRLLIPQLDSQPLLVDTQHDQPMLPAIKPVRSCDHLRQSRAMNKTFRRQTRRRITPPPNGLNPLTLTNNMKDHRDFSRNQNPRAKCCPQHFAILLTPSAGVTPAEGGVEPTAGSTLDDVILITPASTRVHSRAASRPPPSNRYRRSNRSRFSLDCGRAV
jgi:hypothetical protein